MARTNKNNTPPPVPAMKVAPEECPASEFEQWPIKNTKPQPCDACKHSAPEIDQHCGSIGVTTAW